MKLLKGWKLKLFAGLALASIGGDIQAQKPGSLDPSLLGRGPQIGPASYRIPGPPPGMAENAGMYGDPAMSGAPSMGMGMDPNLPQVPCGPDGMPSGPEGYGEQCDGPCDRFGRSPFALLGALGGRLASCRGKLLPYGEGGIATQRWFDVSADVIYLARTSTSEVNFNTTSIGAGTNNFVLGTSSVPLDTLKAGLALQGNIQVGPGSNLEVGYFGLNRWGNDASVTSATPSLFSFLSNFGTTPANGFDDPDRSFVHTLSYSSTLNNGEINLRRRWCEPSGFFQGSMLMGVRYLDIDEQAKFTARGAFDNTQANNSLRFLDYTTNTQNSLVGFQVGGDLWYNVIPGVKLGIEAKTGIYNNRAHQNTAIFANSLPNTFTEEVLANRAAYVTQIAPQAFYRLNHSWAVRGSYQLMYIDNLALATGNFNALPPNDLGLNLGRTAKINTDSDAIYQGFTVGAEYTW
ncbi:MAG: hypothetical protein NTY15_15830 [Planctomycetota bacterium]|nr:hypothetical protein [Planctomycetota bacterium]